MRLTLVLLARHAPVHLSQGLSMDNSPIRITAEETLSDSWYLLKKYSFDLRRQDGSW